MRCDRCGAEGDGNYCARCGAPMGPSGPDGCSACGASTREGDLYCAECGEPLRSRPDRPLVARLPWILSGLALVAFAVAIAYLVQGQASPRIGDAPPTGSVISGDVGPAEGGGAPGSEGGTGPAAGGMPSASELADMSPREAADRLFNRTMRLRATGDSAGRAPFFARMGVRAYRRVPAAEAGPDLRFHVGLLQLVQGEVEAARAEADTILSETPGHLLGLLLAARASGAAGETEAEARWRDSLRTALENTDLSSRPEYRAHADLLETASVSPRDGG